jgi:hypothetical protein
VIATGGYPSLIPMSGLRELHKLNTNPGDEKPRPYVMTNETFFNMTVQPKKMIVVGPGVIGIELSQAMQRLGTSVTVLGRSGRILPKEDNDHASLIKSSLERQCMHRKMKISFHRSQYSDQFSSFQLHTWADASYRARLFLFLKLNVFLLLPTLSLLFFTPPLLGNSFSTCQLFLHSISIRMTPFHVIMIIPVIISEYYFVYLLEFGEKVFTTRRQRDSISIPALFALLFYLVMATSLQ